MNCPPLVNCLIFEAGRTVQSVLKHGINIVITNTLKRIYVGTEWKKNYHLDPFGMFSSPICADFGNGVRALALLHEGLSNANVDFFIEWTIEFVHGTRLGTHTTVSRYPRYTLHSPTTPLHLVKKRTKLIELREVQTFAKPYHKFIGCICDLASMLHSQALLDMAGKQQGPTLSISLTAKKAAVLKMYLIFLGLLPNRWPNGCRFGIGASHFNPFQVPKDSLSPRTAYGRAARRMCHHW